MVSVDGGASTGSGPAGGGVGIASHEAGREYAAWLENRNVHVEFQPVLDLRSGEIVALEALARGPQSSPFATPRGLFEAAHRLGRDTAEAGLAVAPVSAPTAVVDAEGCAGPTRRITGQPSSCLPMRRVASSAAHVRHTYPRGCHRPGLSPRTGCACRLHA
jgi:hypothetical protein